MGYRFKIIRALTKEHNIDPTYKALEPSAGEFPENARQYYSTYEEENESEQVSDNTVLVIGSGAFRLGMLHLVVMRQPLCYLNYDVCSTIL